MGQIHVDDMTLEILCTALRDFRPKSVRAVSKNAFCKNWPMVAQEDAMQGRRL